MLITEKEKFPNLKRPILFVGSCRSGKSYRMEEIARNSKEDFIYILQPFHQIENLDVKEFFRAGPMEQLRQNAVFYTNSFKISDQEFKSVNDIIFFAIKNNLLLLIDETDLKDEIVSTILSCRYTNFIFSSQYLEYSDLYIYFVENVVIGRVNDLITLKNLSKEFNIKNINEINVPEFYIDNPKIKED